ncbi:hypothetical protein SAMN05216389_10667 [Oceanobacillus limi]|uniref:Uncharacterized protein n=1 Tax=Oceanobacillus limi TaxID=930131 RepID=A0A1I0C799_9BACI|nr:hypothetical protein [Oceanobacillus limi]SET15256.1 hypothetical protein SAMN05216389_10667 [Oceanobacillus limi]
MSEISLLSITSPPRDKININNPNVYMSSQGMFITASANWKNKHGNVRWWKDHGPIGIGTLKVGGANGLGIYFSNSTNLDVGETNFYTYDENFNTYNNNLYPHKIDKTGVYYKAQDTMKNSTFNPFHSYSWDTATLSVWPDFKGKVNTNVRTHWTHTWSSGEISSVGVSNSGISVNFSNSSHAWDGVSLGSTNLKNYQ